MVFIFSSCSSIKFPFEINMPQIPEMPESFCSDKIISAENLNSIEDIVNNLLIYEGQRNYYKAISETLETYIRDLVELQNSVNQ